MSLRVSMPANLRDRFKAKCALNRVTMSEKVLLFIQDWLEGDQSNPATLAELVEEYWELLTKSRISLDRLQALRDGARPTEVEQVRIGAVVGDEDLVIELTNRIPNGEDRRMPNGV